MKTENYLKEDQDLLDELSDLGPTMAGSTLENQKRKLSELQIKATLRTRKTMIDLDKSNSRFTTVIIFFTLVQICIAGLQFILDVTSFPNKVFGIFISVALIVAIVVLTNMMNKTLRRDTK